MKPPYPGVAWIPMSTQEEPPSVLISIRIVPASSRKSSGLHRPRCRPTSAVAAFRYKAANADGKLIEGLIDADDRDGDGNPFTVPDPNLDGDNDLYTGYVGPLWLRVEIEGSVTAFETLTAP